VAKNLRHRNHWTGRLTGSGQMWRKTGSLVTVHVELTESDTTPAAQVTRNVLVTMTADEARKYAASLIHFADVVDAANGSS
jgi:hypothetical protein